jgi:LysR family transcriptional activator of dmlA
MDILGAMRIFREVGHSNSFTKASKKLGLTPSGVSKQIATIESELGVALLARSTRKVALTEIGEAYLSHCERILEDVDSTHRNLKELQETPSGLLRVNSTTSFGRSLLSPILSAFSIKYPQIKLEVLLSDRISDIIEEKFDVVIRAGKFDESSFLAKKLIPLRRGFYASPKYIQTHHEPKKASDLESLNYLSFSFTSQFDDSWNLKNDRRNAKINLRGNFRSDDLNVIKQLAIDGAGFAIFTPWFVEEELRKKQLVRILPDWEPTLSATSNTLIYLLYPHVSVVPLKTRVFVDFVSQNLNYTDRK